MIRFLACVLIYGISSQFAPARAVVQDVLRPLDSGKLKLSGWLEGKISTTVSNRVLLVDDGILVNPYRTPVDGFSGEFWGKWATAAALAWDYQGDPVLLERLNQSTARFLATPAASQGYSSYKAGNHLKSFDVWCRKYVILGLLAHYDRTTNQASLQGACRTADYLLQELRAENTKVSDTSLQVLQGTDSSSILEPFALLYQRTGNKLYLDFCREIVADWSRPTKYAPQGLKLLEDALAGKPPFKNHAYAITSCFEGVCELYRATGERRFLDAAIGYARSLQKHEIMVNGSGSNQELWCDGVRQQTEIMEQPNETCLTATWMKYCYQILRLTGDSEWADELERSLYNALLGAMAPNGEWWAYHSGLCGERVHSHMQYADMKLSCCVASGPRALLLTPQWAVMRGPDGPLVNFYGSGSSQFSLNDGTEVTLEQRTAYPIDGEITILVKPARQKEFMLQLRLPGWSKDTRLLVNNEPQKLPQPGTYARLKRTWKDGDQITLVLDLRGRAIPAPSGAPAFALMRGPILLAMDNRFPLPDEVSARLVKNAEGYVDLAPAKDQPQGVMMAFEVPFIVKPQHFFRHHPVKVIMCDFASAGNRWTTNNLYRTWLPDPLHIPSAFPTNTWKTLGIDSTTRPTAPGPQ